MQGVHDGADLVLASGDKIIDGPQAGIVVGKKACVQRLSRHVLARTCRPGKLTLSALEATLAVYLAGRAWEEMPTLRMPNTSEQELSERANAIGKGYFRYRIEGRYFSRYDRMRRCGLTWSSPSHLDRSS